MALAGTLASAAAFLPGSLLARLLYRFGLFIDSSFFSRLEAERPAAVALPARSSAAAPLMWAVTPTTASVTTAVGFLVASSMLPVLIARSAMPPMTLEVPAIAAPIAKPSPVAKPIEPPTIAPPTPAPSIPLNVTGCPVASSGRWPGQVLSLLVLPGWIVPHPSRVFCGLGGKA